MANSQINQPTSVLQLSDDCLYFIFQKFDSGSDRESFGLTCHRWLHIQNSTHRSLQFNCSFSHVTPTSLFHPPTIITPFHLYKLLSRFTKLQSLSLSGCTELPDSGLSILIHYGLNFQSLNLDCCFKITDHGLSFVACGCPFLTSISLYRCNVTDIGLETLSKSCSSLKDVNFSYSSLISDRGMKPLSQNCRHLHSVNISHCRNVNGTGFQGCSNTLAYIEADSCRLSSEGIQAAVSGGGLEYLNISNLVCGPDLTGVDSRCISKLRVLNFRMCRMIGDEDVMRIAIWCPLLQEWNLALCHEVGIVGWETIGLNCHRLERLHVNRCRNLCDGGLSGLRDGCKRLRKLYLGRCGRVSLAGVEMFKCLRGDVEIVDEEVMCIGSELGFRL